MNLLVTKNEGKPYKRCLPFLYGDIINNESNIEFPDSLLDLEIKTEKNSFKISGPESLQQILKLFIELHSENISPYACRWIYYNDEYCLADPSMRVYLFFLIHEYKIIRENVALFENSSDRVVEKLFSTNDDSPLWERDVKKETAFVRMMSDKWLNETTMGRLYLYEQDEMYLFTKEHFSRYVTFNQLKILIKFSKFSFYGIMTLILLCLLILHYV